jgi:hypothetical protein
MGFHFPSLYRIELPDQPVYTLSPDSTSYPHGTSVTHVQSLSFDDQYSLVVRWHASIDAADAYLSALRDMDIAERSDVISQTDRGHFTLVQRSTKSNWPSPMIFYVAECSPRTKPGKTGYWERSISVTGHLYETGMLHANLEM